MGDTKRLRKCDCVFQEESLSPIGESVTSFRNTSLFATKKGYQSEKPDITLGSPMIDVMEKIHKPERIIQSILTIMSIHF